MNTWSLARLAEAAQEQGLVRSISPQTVGTIFREERIIYRRTKTWKEPRDPLCWVKWERINRLYKRCPKGSAVVCFDELGPISVVLQGGRGFSSSEKPRRIPATFPCARVISYFLSTYNVHHNRLWGEMVFPRTQDAALSFLRRSGEGILSRFAFIVYSRTYTFIDQGL